MAMTPEEKERLAAHIQEIAKILYKNTPPEKIETLEGIEWNDKRVYSKNKKLRW